MPKMRSNRAAKKRFRVTASGRVKREHACANHKFTSKSQDRKRHLRKAGYINPSDMRRVRHLIAG